MKRKLTAPMRQLPSGKWQPRLVLADKTRIPLGTFDTSKDANDAYWLKKAEIDSGVYFDDRKGNMPFTDFLELYMDHRKGDWSAGTMRNNRSYAKRHLIPAFGFLMIKDVSVAMVDQWYAKMPKGTNSLNVYRLLSGAMKKAVRWGYIQTTPCIVDKPGTGTTKKRTPRTEQDFKTVVARVPEEFQPVFWVLYAAHLRISEAGGLNRGDWDPFTKRLNIERQLSAVTSTLTDTKTGQHGKVRLLPGGLEQLEKYISDHPALPDEPMFAGPKGGRLRSAYIRTLWNRACAAAGYADFHVHDNRRTGLTKVMDATGNWKAVKARGRHITDAAALSYQDFTDELDAAVIAAMEAQSA